MPKSATIIALTYVIYVQSTFLKHLIYLIMNKIMERIVQKIVSSFNLT